MALAIAPQRLAIPTAELVIATAGLAMATAGVGHGDGKDLGPWRTVSLSHGDGDAAAGV